MLVTPWFAAGAAFLLASGLWIYSPHASLTLPSPYQSPCTQPNCATGHGVVAGKGGTLRTPGTASGGGRQAGTGVRAGSGAGLHNVRFKFTVIQRYQGWFMAEITITGKHPLGSWRLSFTVPQTQITSVWGAQWKRAGQDGGTASAYQRSAGQFGGSEGGFGGGFGEPDPNSFGPGGTDPGPRLNSPDSFPDDRSGPGGSRETHFWIQVTGQPSTPRDCRYDGETCAFTRG